MNEPAFCSAGRPPHHHGKPGAIGTPRPEICSQSRHSESHNCFMPGFSSNLMLLKPIRRIVAICVYSLFCLRPVWLKSLPAGEKLPAGLNPTIISLPPLPPLTFQRSHLLTTFKGHLNHHQTTRKQLTLWPSSTHSPATSMAATSLRLQAALQHGVPDRSNIP